MGFKSITPQLGIRCPHSKRCSWQPTMHQARPTDDQIAIHQIQFVLWIFCHGQRRTACCMLRNPEHSIGGAQSTTPGLPSSNLITF